MNKQQFTKLMSIKGSKKFNRRMTHNAAIDMTNLFLDTLADALLLDGIVKLDNYLVFEVREPTNYSVGQLRNPKTGEIFAPKKRKRLGIRCGKKLREIIQGYDKSAQHDLSWLVEKKRSNKDSDGDDYE